MAELLVKTCQRFSRGMSLVFLFLLLTAYTGVPQVLSSRAFHSLSFDPSRERVGIQTIYYRYGSADQFGLRTSPDQIASGKSTGVGITGELQVGDDFYAKWRVVATGQVLEDTVDLKSRLPFHMDK
jgi:hypothetical protein